MMSYLLHLLKLDKNIVKYTTKSNEEANKLLAEAKEQLNKKISPWYSVIEIYTKAMVYAEPNSSELAKAYANRSAIFCNEGLYEDCLLDVDKALTLGYPDELKAKLYFRRVKALWESNKYIPCKKCTKVIFCNEACREAAWNKFHDIECEILASLPKDKFAWFDIMSVQLTIKAIKEAGSLGSLKKLVDEIKSNSDKNNFEKKIKHKSYSTIYNLYSDLKFSQKSNLYKDYPVRSAYLLSVFASKTQLLNNTSDDLRDLVNNELAIFLGGLILRHMNISSLNTFEGMIVKDKIKYKRSKLLGSIASYFNHSCDDNVSCNQYADKLVIRAIRNIKKDEQLFITYGPLFQTDTIKERREKLELQYNFLCNCIPCSKNWGPDSVISSWMDQALLIDRKYRVIAVYQKYSHFFKVATEKEINDKMNFDTAYIAVLLDIINELCENVSYPCIELISFKAALSYNYVATG
ncbi:hypothetical protein G9C98_000002 [Cotesia typhae]|uniref:SET domain-containing protein n=1 Tax=Cotesia typhae TaxID=2053667 RepID=A0A8J5QZN6_9HYME|nr:hypothetical protein G9C98_000002 [Cotesia typhae]